MQKWLGKLSISLLVVLSLLAVSCAKEEPAQAAAPAAPAAAQQSDAAKAIPDMIDMTMPENTITLRLAYDDPTLWPKTGPTFLILSMPRHCCLKTM